MKKTVLRKYAQLIAQTGVNVQPGQEVFIAADLDQPEFVKMLVEECYKRKAKKVVVDWSYQPLQKLHYRYRTLTTLSKLDNYEEARWQHYVDTYGYDPWGAPMSTDGTIDLEEIMFLNHFLNLWGNPL